MNSLEELVKRLTELLLELGEVEKRKLEAIHAGKVLDVEECMKSEQVYTMQFRALEKKTDELLAPEGFAGKSLGSIIGELPEERRKVMEPLWEELRRALADFQGVNDAAQDLLKTELHKMDKKLQGNADKSSSASGKQEYSFHPRKA